MTERKPDPPEFIRTIPEEVEQYGPAAALVLAHIRFRCASDGPGRVVRDGHRWWHISHQDLGQEVGMSAKAVRGALKALRATISATHYPPLSNQSRHYRVVEGSESVTCQKTDRADADQPVDRTGIPDAPEGNSSRPNGHLQMPHRASVLLTGEVKKEGEAAGSRQAAAPLLSTSQSGNGKPTYTPRCPKHIHIEHPPACHGCGEARAAAKAAAESAEEREAAERNRIRDAIDRCRECDQYGRLDDLTDCPKHPNFRVIPVVA